MILFRGRQERTEGRCADKDSIRALARGEFVRDGQFRATGFERDALCQ